MTRLMRVAVPPGLGDVHWVLLKLEDFFKQHGQGYDGIDVGVLQCSRPRALEYVKMVPFIKAAHYTEPEFLRPAVTSKDYIACVVHGTKNIVKDWMGYDYLMAFNGYLRNGVPIEMCEPEIGINWKYEIRRDESDIALEQSYRDLYGKFGLLYFPTNALKQCGAESPWEKKISAKFVVELCQELRHRFPGTVFVLSGADWDFPGVHQRVMEIFAEYELPICNATGDTDIPHLFAMLRSCEFFVGVPAGNGILAEYLGAPTVLLWSTMYHRTLWNTWARPGSEGTSYSPMDVAMATPESVAETALILSRATKPACVGNVP